MPGSNAGGFAEGLWGSIDAQRQRARQDEDRRSAREGTILQLLAEHGKPDIQSMALQGLIQSANPKQWKKGLGGFLGEYEPNPAVGQIHQYLQTPETVTTQHPTADFESRPMPLQPQSSPPPRPGQSPEDTVQAMQYTATPPPMMTETTSRPRQALYTPAEEAGMQVDAQARARISGARAEMQAAGIPAAEQQQAILRMVGGRYGVGGAGAGGRLMKGKVIPDPNSQTGFSEILLSPTDGHEVARSPAMDPTKAGGGRGSKIDLGDAFEIAARHEGFPDGASVTDPADVDRVMQVAAAYKSDTAGDVKTAQGIANARVPLSTPQQFEGYNKLTDDWKKTVAPVREMQRQYNLMQVGLQRYKADPIGGSQAVLVTFQKILDPESVVRESEYSRTPEGLAIMSRLQGMYDRYIGKWDPTQQKWVGGGAGVPEAELAEMTATAKQMVDSVQGWNDGERARVSELATTYGLKPELIFGGPAASRPPGGGPPARPAGASAGPPAGPQAQTTSGKTTTEAKLKARAAALGVSPDVLRQELVTKGGYTIVP